MDPLNEQSTAEPSIESLLSAASQADEGKLDPHSEGANETAQDRSGAEADKTEKGTEQQDEPKTNDPAKDAEKTEGKDSEKGSETKTEEEKEESAYRKAQKDAERLHRSWKKLEEEKAALRAEREKLTQQPPKTESAKDPNGYSAEDYEKFAETTDDPDLAKKALAKAAELRKQSGEQKQQQDRESFNQGWTNNVQKLIEANPDMADQNSALGQKINAVLKENPAFSLHPDGIKAAVELAKSQLQSGLVSDLQKENETLKKEIERLNKLTQPGGGGPAARQGTKSFEDMSPAEQQAHLQRAAEEADRG